MTEPALLEVDSRRRVTLGPLATADRYLATRLADGRVILEPAVVVTETALGLAQDPAFRARVAEAAERPVQPFPDSLL